MNKQDYITAKTTDFKTLFEATKDRLYRLFIKHIHNASVAEDLLQDCYLKMWEKRDSIDTASAEAYLYKMAYHTIISWHRKEIRKKIIYLEQLPENKDEHTPETALQYTETYRRIEKVISQLPATKQHAFLLIKEKEKSYKEAAAELNVPVSTLEKQIAGSLKAIRKVLTIFGGII